MNIDHLKGLFFQPGIGVKNAQKSVKFVTKTGNKS